MQKKIILLVLAINVATTIWAESSSLLSFGLRGGGNTYINDGVAQAQIGYGGLFDLGYTFYGKANNAEVGFRIGCSAGYCTSSFKGSVDRQFSNTDYLGNVVLYSVSSPSLTQRFTQQIQVEVPLMLAIRTNQIFINLGAKFMMPLYDTYEQDMSGVIIDAYYAQPDVHITNRLITGVANDQILTGANILPKYNVLISAELGYEWKINEMHRIGLGIYADVSPWNTFKETKTSQIIDVAPITDVAYPPAQVSVQPLCYAGATKLLYCDFGIKFYYGINWTHKANKSDNGNSYNAQGTEEK